MRFAPTFAAWVVTSALMVCGASAQAAHSWDHRDSRAVLHADG